MEDNMSISFRKIMIVLMPVVLALCAGCATKGDSYFKRTKSTSNVFVLPESSDIQRIAVMPFKAPSPNVGSTVSELIGDELARTRRYEVIDSMLVLDAVRRTGASDS